MVSDGIFRITVGLRDSTSRIHENTELRHYLYRNLTEFKQLGAFLDGYVLRKLAWEVKTFFCFGLTQAFIQQCVLIKVDVSLWLGNNRR